MNYRKAGKFAVTTIVGILSAIAGIASMEMLNSLKKETETGPDSACGESDRVEERNYHDTNG